MEDRLIAEIYRIEEKFIEENKGADPGYIYGFKEACDTIRDFIIYHYGE